MAKKWTPAKFDSKIKRVFEQSQRKAVNDLTRSIKKIDSEAKETVNDDNAAGKEQNVNADKSMQDLQDLFEELREKL